MQKIMLSTRVGVIAANLYSPKNVAKPPLIIITGAWTTVKEQMPTTYAKALQERGFAALVFDFRGWGGSEDQAKYKYLEDPVRKTEDIHAVVEAISANHAIEVSEIYGLGVCASSGYMLNAASQSSDLKAVALVAPWLHDQALATNIYGGEESVNGLLEMSDEAQQSEQPSYIEAASLTNENALMYQAPYYTETDRGLISEYDNKFNVASLVNI
ncbi:alpha/beta hydrolase [Shewanella sp. 202IG2-18]|uniref:alpha/beta hydrolase n=1 Tax=Parashewanella hymeniacidonis TaxID=2807618 RepID=UPI0019602A5B|nr:alpha/beta hydrolase [Parashewanella hymeniacidonis]MBM7074325.1 alpha/beta hydrolase [Parashewanella hymeniacidonis]